MKLYFTKFYLSKFMKFYFTKFYLSNFYEIVFNQINRKLFYCTELRYNIVKFILKF